MYAVPLREGMRVLAKARRARWNTFGPERAPGREYMLARRRGCSIWSATSVVGVGLPLLAIFMLTGTILGSAQPPAPTLDDYVGRYELTPSFHLDVSREGRALYLQVTGQPRAQLTPRGIHEFVLVGSTLRVMFGVRQDTGEVIDLLFEQGGLGRRARKLADDEVVPGVPQMDLTVEVIDRYVGKYVEQPGFAMTITREGAQLYGQLTDLEPDAIFSLSQTEFFYQDSSARIIFYLDDVDVATTLILRQGDNDIEMHRVGQ